MTRIGSSARASLSSRTALIRRIAGSPRLTTARRRNVRSVTEGTVGTLGPLVYSCPYGVPPTHQMAGGPGRSRGASGRPADLGRDRRDGRAQLQPGAAAGAAGP